MGKISKLPDVERLAIIGYLAQEGVVDTITAEVPLRKCADFQEKYGIAPYPIRSDKKYSEQLRVYLSDPESAPPLLKAALDPSKPRLNDNEFIHELVDVYGFTFFGKQNSKLIQERAKQLGTDDYSAFISGFSSNDKFISALTTAVQGDSLPTPVVNTVESDATASPKKRGRSKGGVIDSNASFSDQQLLLLGWAGEEYLYKYLAAGTEAAFASFSIDVRSVEDVIWYNEGYSTAENWSDGSVGKGCDILVKTKDSDRFIEVKSSRRHSPVFGMTSYEMQKMKELRSLYFLAKIDYLEKILSGEAPSLRVFKDPFSRFFDPARMQKAVFYYE